MVRILPLLLLAALPSCAGPAALAGEQAGFQALGHDPGWVLTMRDGRLKFVGTDPQTVMEVVPPPAEPLAYGRRYVTGRLTLEITRSPCNDPKSGIAFAETVLVTVDGYRFEGCGGERVPLLDS